MFFHTCTSGRVADSPVFGLMHLSLEPVTACPLCRSSGVAADKYVFGEYRIVSCRKCGVEYLTPRLSADSIQAFYSSPNYFKGESPNTGYVDYLAEEAEIRRTSRRRLTLVRKYVASGAICSRLVQDTVYFWRKRKRRASA